MQGEADTTTLADAIISRLEEHGVMHVFGIPGTHNLPLYDALSRSRIVHITPRHEQGAGYGADGYSRASGKPGVCLVTTGPGVTNVMTATATAHADSVPLLVLSPGMSDEVDGGDTGFLHELRDQHGMMGRIVRSVRVRSTEHAIAAIDEPFAGFRAGRPRPVHIEIPLDRFEARGRPRFEPIAMSPPVASERAIGRAAELLVNAERPAIVLGGGATDAGPAALTLARLLAAPVVTTVGGKGTIPERDSLALGSSIRLRCIQEFLRDRDVLLVVGSELGESDLWHPPPLECSGAIIRVDIDPAQLQKNAASDLAIHGEAATTLGRLVDRLQGETGRRLPENLTALRRAALIEARQDGARFEPLVEVLAMALAPDAIVASDSTMTCYYGIVHFLAQDRPRQLLYPTGFATLGYGLPAAIGAKLACPRREVVAVLGDGGVLFTIQELATAVELGLTLPIIVVTNGGYGEIRRAMSERGMDPLGVDLAAPDFCRIAEGFGAVGCRARSYGELGPLLAQALSRIGPTVIEVAEEADP